MISILLDKFWILLSIIELIIILLISYKLWKNKNKEKVDEWKKFKQENKSEVDMSGVIDSINNSSILYKRLIKVCHPDRFTTNPEMMSIASELSLRISEFQYDHKKLLELKQEAIEKLSVKP